MAYCTMFLPQDYLEDPTALNDTEGGFNFLRLFYEWAEKVMVNSPGIVNYKGGWESWMVRDFYIYANTLGTYGIDLYSEDVYIPTQNIATVPYSLRNLKKRRYSEDEQDADYIEQDQTNGTLSSNLVEYDLYLRNKTARCDLAFNTDPFAARDAGKKNSYPLTLVEFKTMMAGNNGDFFFKMVESDMKKLSQAKVNPQMKLRSTSKIVNGQIAVDTRGMIIAVVPYWEEDTDEGLNKCAVAACNNFLDKMYDENVSPIIYSPVARPNDDGKQEVFPFRIFFKDIKKIREKLELRPEAMPDSLSIFCWTIKFTYTGEQLVPFLPPK